ncbi:MAG: VRR-NUC domain-containing protein [Tannerellaceae bacterium]|nr:VRR-NUC domain-containing protein [Tannerellaceae bacterium]
MSEASFQCACVKWFDLQFPRLSFLLFAVPNGGYRNKREAKSLQRQGVRPGVSDLILLFPRGGYSCLCIELKIGKNGQSDEQKAWQRLAEAAGAKYVVCWTIHQFMKEVTTYLGIRE